MKIFLDLVQWRITLLMGLCLSVMIASPAQADDALVADDSLLSSTFSKVRIGSEVKAVRITGGGNSIVIVDVKTGTTLYEIAPSNADLNISEMQYSITGRIAAVDRDRDGLADHVYVADLGGQIFRFDIYNGMTGRHLVKGGLLADFNGDTEASNRRFYSGPDVTNIVTEGKSYFVIAIGSGFQYQPSNTAVQDSFYLFKDKGVYIKDEQGHYTFPSTAIGHDDLFDVTAHQLTAHDIGELNTAQASLQLQLGWRIDLGGSGEKVLTVPIILNHQIFFTTYLPNSTDACQSLMNKHSGCDFSIGHARAYLVDLLTGNAVVDLNQDRQTTSIDRYTSLKQTGMVSKTEIVLNNLAKPMVCLGEQCSIAVIEFDQEGNEIPCSHEFACLTREIFGRFERIQPQSWTTEIERKP